MSANLIQDTAGSVVVFIADVSGSPSTELTTSDVSVNLKKPSYSGFLYKSLTDTTNATADIGSGTDGTVTVESPGNAGNSYTVEVVVDAGTVPLSVDVAGTAITVNLATNAGTPITGQNTATLVASAIDNAFANGFATASGDGSGEITSAEGPNALNGGVDGDFTNLGDGFYQIALDATDTDELGTLYIRVTGPAITVSLDNANVIEVAPTTEDETVIVIPDTTIITGTIVDVTGVPQSGVKVLAQVLSVPTIVAGVGVSTENTTVSTDSNGQFTLTLLTGSQVDVLIPAINYRRTITVPDSSADLFDIA